MKIKKGVLVASVMAATIAASGCASTKSKHDVPPPPASNTTVTGGTSNTAFTTTTASSPSQQAVMMKDHSSCKGMNSCHQPVHNSMHGDPYADNGTSSHSHSANMSDQSHAMDDQQPSVHNSWHGDPYQQATTVTTQPKKPYQQGASPHDEVRAGQTLDNTDSTTASDNSGASSESNDDTNY